MPPKNPKTSKETKSSKKTGKTLKTTKSVKSKKPGTRIAKVIKSSKIINSVNNPSIKEIVKLQKNATYRREVKKFVVEGIHLVAEALKKGIVEAVYLTQGVYEELYESLPRSNDQYFIIKNHVADKVSMTVHNQGIFAVCKMVAQEVDYDHDILLLDRVQDPGNIGTLIRSAASFDFRTVISAPTSVSFYNDKVIRSTQGNFFQINLVREYLMQTINDLKEEGYVIIGTQMHEESKMLPKVRLKDNQKYAVVIGNESKGISPEISRLIDYNVLIPMEEEVESLNAAVAGSILMYEIYEHKL